MRILTIFFSPNECCNLVALLLGDEFGIKVYKGHTLRNETTELTNLAVSYSRFVILANASIGGSAVGAFSGDSDTAILSSKDSNGYAGVGVSARLKLYKESGKMYIANTSVSQDYYWKLVTIG